METIHKVYTPGDDYVDVKLFKTASDCFSHRMNKTVEYTVVGVTEKQYTSSFKVDLQEGNVLNLYIAAGCSMGHDSFTPTQAYITLKNNLIVVNVEDVVYDLREVKKKGRIGGTWQWYTFTSLFWWYANTEAYTNPEKYLPFLYWRRDSTTKAYRDAHPETYPPEPELSYPLNFSVFETPRSKQQQQIDTLDSPIERRFATAWLNTKPNFTLKPQYRIGQYVVDFVHEPTKTVIELDGFEYHSSSEDLAKDRKRDRVLSAQGWYVCRFGGKEITQDVRACVQEVIRILNDRTV